MDNNFTCNNNNNKSPPALRKVKKKQGKDEMDRLKQAEKKKRRLEKALATSAAIRSELEKKKQKKKEEQQRLDEEGAAIAEAVALHVLLGEEDTDDKFDCSTSSFLGEEGWGWSRTELCPGLLAAQAVSSLQIRDDANLNTIFVDEVLRW